MPSLASSRRFLFCLDSFLGLEVVEMSAASDEVVVAGASEGEPSIAVVSEEASPVVEVAAVEAEGTGAESEVAAAAAASALDFASLVAAFLALLDLSASGLKTSSVAVVASGLEGLEAA